MQKEQEILVLQGGGALGAYQAGAYEGLVNAGHNPSWIAGISIGAINAAIIAGNEPAHRTKRLREFWELLSSGLQAPLLFPDIAGRTVFNEVSSYGATLFGIPGFFAPRMIPAIAACPGTPGATSYYDTAPLLETLNRLVDFDRLNNSETRVSVGAVNIKTGNFRYFDTAKERITAGHIMASGALPPGFPPVKIDGAYYWDGGLVSNTPLQYVVEESAGQSCLCIFQIDLFSAKGTLPNNIMEVAEREKEIRYSSRTRMVTDALQKQQALRVAIRDMLQHVPADQKNGSNAKLLAEISGDLGITVMHLINRASEFDTQSKDYEFSRLSMEEHWEAGLLDARKSLATKAWKNRPIPPKGMITFDHGRINKDENE